MGAAEEASVKWPGPASTIYGFAGAVASEGRRRAGRGGGRQAEIRQGPG
jgi:hypothetical protein